MQKWLVVSALTGSIESASRMALKQTIRLVDGPTVSEGRLEILHDEKWGTVCDDSFSLNNAHVFCRMLGYTQAQKYHHSARYGKGEGPIWLDEVNCKGTEVHVSNCTSNPWGETDCEHHEDISLLCTTERIPGFDLLRLNKAQIHDDNNFKLRI